MYKYEEEAIILINKSIKQEMPLGQGGLPDYYNTRMNLLHRAIQMLEKGIKDLKKQKRGSNYSMNYNNNNNNNTNNNNNNDFNINGNFKIEGGKRKRYTRKVRKTRK
jgi:hypothetical protein